MNEQRVAKQPDGSYRWTCRIDIGYHKEQTKTGFRAVGIIAAALLLIGVIIAAQTRSWESLWISILVAGVVLLIALPLLRMSSNATEPMEEYWMTDVYIKSGYGRSSVFSHFSKTEAMRVFNDHLELVEKGKTRRIYVPAEDIDFVVQYVSDHLPQNTPVGKPD